ncbi:GGDEF domain-containing protein [Piscinibacter sp.]|uniref:GGDEF domain-containing protein n=1 Tax=Piscinibacter sp. TaxID=1903157 RepID=UPI002C4206A8|nr:diguanylate cyclase [Albitalea sp.]HUG25615.1 diguanylate cyclase [Albitalea sp.]
MNGPAASAGSTGGIATSPAHLPLGKEPAQRRAIKRLLLRIEVYVAVWAMMAIVAYSGFAPPGPVLVCMGYAMVFLSASYALVHRGWAPALVEPRFTFVQVMLGVSVLVLGYWLMPFVRSGALQVVFVLLAFDMHRLSARQLNIATGTAIAMLALVWVELWSAAPPGESMLEEALSIVMAALFIPVLAAIGRAVRGIHLRQKHQRAELADALAQLEFLSQRDGLTGAVNRRHMTVLLDEEAKRQRRSGRPMTIAMLDIDWFKRVNDGHGHAVGDGVLKQTTRSAMEVLRATDVLARWGGEEFLLLMPETTAAQAIDVVERVRRQVREADWSQFAPGLTISISCGVSEHDIDATPAQTLKRADAVLYRAKEQGRDRVCAD